MDTFIAFDPHKHCTLVETEDIGTGRTRRFRVNHSHGAIRACLKGCDAGAPVAPGSIGSRYRTVDETGEADVGRV